MINSVERLGDIAVAVPAGEKLEVMVGDTVRVRATIEYRGPALSDTFHAAIGIRGIAWFDEIWVGESPVFFDKSPDWDLYELTADIPIDVSRPDVNYDLYVKLNGHLEAGLPEIDNVIDVLGAAEFRSFEIISYEKV